MTYIWEDPGGKSKILESVVVARGSGKCRNPSSPNLGGPEGVRNTQARTLGRGLEHDEQTYYGANNFPTFAALPPSNPFVSVGVLHSEKYRPQQ